MRADHKGPDELTGHMRGESRLEEFTAIMVNSQLHFMENVLHQVLLDHVPGINAI